MSVLDNPIWNALGSRHAAVAQVRGNARRYPAEVAPFVSIAGESGEADLLSLVAPGEKVGILSVMSPLSDDWSLVYEIDLHQMVCRDDVLGEPDPEVVVLDESHLQDMLELTALVYPAYFRPGTARLGPYVGIYEEGRLGAMAGVRMAMDGYQELSAICTHPDHRGRGNAFRLSRHLIHLIRQSGEVPFLHTESANLAAQALYRKIGFDLRKELPFRVMVRC